MIISMFQKGLAPILIVLLIAAVIVGYLIYSGKINSNQKQIACTMDAKVCPDGTSVGRSGPKCEFASCPLSKTDETANWKTYTDTSVKYSLSYSFKYPADYKSYFKNGNALYSSDAQFDKVTTAKTKGVEIGSLVYGPGEDAQKYIGPNTKIDSKLTAKMVLPEGGVAKAYVNLEDITVTIDYKKDNQDIRIMIWCGGENGNPDSCKKVLTLLLPTFKFTN